MAHQFITGERGYHLSMHWLSKITGTRVCHGTSATFCFLLSFSLLLFFHYSSICICLCARHFIYPGRELRVPYTIVSLRNRIQRKTIVDGEIESKTDIACRFRTQEPYTIVFDRARLTWAANSMRGSWIAEAQPYRKFEVGIWLLLEWIHFTPGSNYSKGGSQ